MAGFMAGLRTLGALCLCMLLAHGAAARNGSGGDCRPAGQVHGADADGMPGGEAIFQYAEDLVALGYRRSGTPSGLAASAYVACQLKAMGLEVHYETAPTWLWQADAASLEVNGEPVDAFPIPHSFVEPGQTSRFSTGREGLQAELVDVAQLDDPAAVKGKVALFDLAFTLPNAVFLDLAESVYDPGDSLAADSRALTARNPFVTNLVPEVRRLMDAGAVAVIGVLADYFDSNRYHNELYRALDDMRIPGMWITAREGEALRRRIAADDGPATVRLRLEGSRRQVEGRSVVAVLPGRSRDTIQVQSHHDSVFDGAVEDASGVSLVLALAEYFAAVPPAEREKTLMFTTMDTHFSGYQSHQAFVSKYITGGETPYRIVANVTLEHVGRQVAHDGGDLRLTGQVEPRGILANVSPALTRVIGEAVERHGLERTMLLSADRVSALGRQFGDEGIPTDASFVYVAGVPTVSLISGPVYLYDAADTLDKVAKEQLQPVARAFADIIAALDATPPGRIGTDSEEGR